MKNVITLEQFSALIRKISDLYDGNIGDIELVQVYFDEQGRPVLDYGMYQDFEENDSEEYVCDFVDALASLEADETVLLSKDDVLSIARKNLSYFVETWIECTYCDEAISTKDIIQSGDSFQCPICGGKHTLDEILDQIQKAKNSLNYQIKSFVMLHNNGQYEEIFEEGGIFYNIFIEIYNDVEYRYEVKLSVSEGIED